MMHETQEQLCLSYIHVLDTHSKRYWCSVEMLRNDLLVAMSQSLPASSAGVDESGPQEKTSRLLIAIRWATILVRRLATRLVMP